MYRTLTSQQFHHPVRHWKNSPTGPSCLIKWDYKESVESLCLWDFPEVAKEPCIIFVKNGCKLQKSHIKDLLKMKFYLWGFSGPQNREECCNKGINLVLGSQNLVNFSFQITRNSPVDCNWAIISVHTFFSIRRDFPIAWLVASPLDRILSCFSLLRAYSLWICLKLVMSYFPMQSVKVSIHAKQQLCYGTGIRCNIKH